MYKNRIDPTSNEYHQDQKWGFCTNCGTDALCEYDNYLKSYSFCCQNENCPHHWPPSFVQKKEDVPDWFSIG